MMESISFQVESNEELWEIVDKSVPYIFLHRFNPHQSIEWFNGSVSVESNEIVKNGLIRNMQFDLQTDLSTLQQILQMNHYYLSIYQFNKPIPGTLVIENLPEENNNSILQQNGLEHIIWIEYEWVRVSSFNSAYLSRLKAHFSS